MKQKVVEEYFRKLLVEGLGLDINDPELKDTPARVAKMYCQDFLCNVGKEFRDFKKSPNVRKYNQIIMSDRIHFTSICSHHFLPFTGHAWILYIPADMLVGYSKMARVVNHYAARPQLQETLCHDVIECFDRAMKPQGTMVLMRAIHGCSKCRGAKQYGGSGMTTSAVSGVFLENDSLEQKGLNLVMISLADKEG